MLRKGNRVGFRHDNKLHFGTVVKGGSRAVQVIADGKPGSVWKGPANSFILSDKPLPVDVPSVMDRYTLKGYKEITGHGDSRTFDANIYRDNKKIGYVQNNGWGGCDDFNFDGRDLETEFIQDVKAWAHQFDYPDLTEPLDYWVEWYQHERPYGVTAEASLTEHKERMDAILQQRVG